MKTFPKSPNFNDNSNDVDSDTQPMYEDEYGFDIPNDNDNDNDELINDYAKEFSLLDERFSENIAVKSICDTLKDFSHADNNINKPKTGPPSPLQGSIEERCKVSLRHISAGLSCLKYFATNEEQISHEMAQRKKEEEKRKIIHEEQHPLMAKPFQPIPLPYEPLIQQQKHNEAMMSNPDVTIPMGWSGMKSEHGQNKQKKTKSNKNKRNTPSKEEDKNGKSNSKQILIATKRSAKIYGSWNVHLKLLLIEKSCLTYATLAEHNYEVQNFGICLRAIHLSFICQQVVSKFMESLSPNKSCLLGRVGDCFFQIVKNFSKINAYVEQYNNFDYENKGILDQLEKDLDEGIL